MDTGFALHSLTKMANAMVGGLVAVEYLFQLMSISAAAFFAARYSGDIEIKVGEFNAYREGRSSDCAHNAGCNSGLKVVSFDIVREVLVLCS